MKAIIYRCFAAALLYCGVSATAATTCPTQLQLRIQAQPGNLVVHYQADHALQALRLPGSAQLASAFIPLSRTQLISDAAGQLELRQADKSGGTAQATASAHPTLSVQLQSLAKTINATYAPYVRTQSAHGLYLPALLPVALQTAEQQTREQPPREQHRIEKQWQAVDPACIQVHYQAGDQSRQLASDTGFLLLPDAASGPDRNNAQVELYRSTGFPQWIEQKVFAEFTEFYQYYLRQLQRPAPHKLRVMLAFEQTKQPFYDGGVHHLSDGPVFVLRFGGEPWQKFDVKAAERITSFIAHEVFHVFTPPDSKTAWLHEGAAEVASLYAARDLGHLTDETYRATHNLRTLSCLLQYGHLPIPTAGNWPGRYPCGYTLLSHLFKGNTFFKSWAALVRQQPADQLAFLSQSLSPARVNALQLLHEPQSSAATVGQSYAALLQPLLVPEDLKDDMYRTSIFTHLMATNCQGSVSFFSFHDSVKLDDLPQCPASLRQLEGKITAVNDLPLRVNRPELLKNYLNGCVRDGVVRLHGPGVSREVPCALAEELSRLFRLGPRAGRNRVR